MIISVVRNHRTWIFKLLDIIHLKWAYFNKNHPSQLTNHYTENLESNIFREFIIYKLYFYDYMSLGQLCCVFFSQIGWKIKSFWLESQLYFTAAKNFILTGNRNSSVLCIGRQFSVLVFIVTQLDLVTTWLLNVCEVLGSDFITDKMIHKQVSCMLWWKSIGLRDWRRCWRPDFNSYKACVWVWGMWLTTSVGEHLYKCVMQAHTINITWLLCRKHSNYLMINIY